MAKKKRNKPARKTTLRRSSAVKKRVAAVTPTGRWPERPTPPDENGFFRKAFWATALVALILMIAMALGSGINADDEYQVDYSEKLVNYYLTLGADTAALHVEKGNMHLYGGFFDLLTGLANRAMGWTPDDLAYYDLRHVCNALFGWLTIVFIALFVHKLAGWRGAIWALVIAFLSPRLLGHGLMNPKDIPFALGFAMATYFMVGLLQHMPRPRKTDLWGLALGVGIALGTRAGGLLLFGYLGLFALLDLWLRYRWSWLGNAALWRSYVGWGLAAAAGGYLLGIAVWPWALQQPLSHPLEALSEFSKLGVRIRVLYQGMNIMSDETPWYYLPDWIWRTIPLSVLLGLVVGIVWLPRLLRYYQPLPVLLAVFSALFPIVYVIVRDSTLHDGWRHLLFVYPPMVVWATLSWLWLEQRYAAFARTRQALYLALGLMLLEPALFIARNPHWPYVYFNMVSGGISHAFGRFETDYWGVSMKQAVKWLGHSGALPPADADQPLTIASSFSYNLGVYLIPWRGQAKGTYVRFNDRYSKYWDYGIFPSRYIRGPHLRSLNWPNSKAVHTLAANGVPLTAIERDTAHHAFRANQAIKQRDYDTAFRELKAELRLYPDNELAWTQLANVYLMRQQLAEAEEAARQALKVAPQNSQAYYFLGMALVNQGKLEEAYAQFEAAVAQENFAAAWYYMGYIKAQQGEGTRAIELLNKAIQANTRFRQAYELAAHVYEQLGYSEQAQRYRQAAAQLQ